MIKYKIKLSSSLDGSTSVSFKENEELTWIELTKHFSNMLKTIGYIPTDLDKFLEEYDETI